MPIAVKHGDDAALLRGSNVAGQGELQNQADQISLDAARINAQLAQREQEVAINAELRARDQWADQQRLAADVAMKQQAQAAAAAAQRASLEAQLFRAAMSDQNALQQLMLQNDFEMQAQSQQAAEKQIGEELAALRKANLDPQGRRLYAELFAKRQEILGRRDLPQAVRDDLLGQWAADYAQADLWSYEQKEPTAWDDFTPMQGQQVQEGQPLPPGMYMRVTGERNGVVQREPFYVFGAEGPPSRPAKDGGLLIMQQDGKWEYQAPIKQEQPKPDPNAPKPLAPKDRAAFIKQAWEILDAQAKNKAMYGDGSKDAEGNVVTLPYVPPDMQKDVIPLAEDLIRAAGGADDQQDDGMFGSFMGTLRELFGGAGQQGQQTPAGMPPAPAAVPPVPMPGFSGTPGAVPPVPMPQVQSPPGGVPPVPMPQFGEPQAEPDAIQLLQAGQDVADQFGLGVQVTYQSGETPTRADAARHPVGTIFKFNGQWFLKISDTHAEPL